MEKLNKKDLVDLISDEMHVSKKEARDAIEFVLDHIEKSLVQGVEVNLTNFGVFTPYERKTRVGTHPKKHDRIQIEGCKSVKFRPSKALKDAVNG